VSEYKANLVEKLLFSPLKKFARLAGGRGGCSTRSEYSHCWANGATVPRMWKIGGAKEQPDATITDLLQAVNTLKADIRGLRLEWESTYDKLMKVVSRLNARHRREAQTEETIEPDRPAEPVGIGTHDLLSAARARRR